MATQRIGTDLRWIPVFTGMTDGGGVVVDFRVPGGDGRTAGMVSGGRMRLSAGLTLR